MQSLGMWVRSEKWLEVCTSPSLLKIMIKTAASSTRRPTTYSSRFSYLVLAKDPFLTRTLPNCPNTLITSEQTVW